MASIFKKISGFLRSKFKGNKKDWMFSKEFQDAVEELCPEIKEQSFRIELEKNHKDVLIFSNLCLETIDVWIEDTKFPSLTYKQKVAIITAHKSRRLLRSAQLLLFSGYLPEADIIGRSLLELTVLVHYIFSDKTEKRAKKWIHFNPHQRWDFSLISQEFMGDKLKGAYCNFSNYCHPHAAGSSRFLKEMEEGWLRFERGPIKDFQSVKDQILWVSNTAVSVLETFSKEISPPQRWIEKHDEIINSEIFQDRFLKHIKPLLDAEDEDFMKIINSLDQ
jgi:hypothetical protein